MFHFFLPGLSLESALLSCCFFILTLLGFKMWGWYIPKHISWSFSASFSWDIDLIVQIQKPPVILKHSFVTHRFHDEFDVKNYLLIPICGNSDFPSYQYFIRKYYYSFVRNNITYSMGSFSILSNPKVIVVNFYNHTGNLFCWL